MRCPADVVVHPSISVRVSDFQRGPWVQKNMSKETYDKNIKRDLYMCKQTCVRGVLRVWWCTRGLVRESRILSTVHGCREVQVYQKRITTNMSKKTYKCAKRPACEFRVFSTAHGFRFSRQIYQKRLYRVLFTLICLFTYICLFTCICLFT